MTARRETETIRCEACQGRGWNEEPIPGRKNLIGHHFARTRVRPCSLCGGSGRESAAVHPREGEKK